MIIVDKNKKVPLYEQLFLELRKDIISGELKKDEQLKPIRILAKELNVSRNTVTKAYQQLLAEGYIRGIRGSGYYVEELFDFPIKVSYTTQTRKEPPAVREELLYDFDYRKYSNEMVPWNRWIDYLKNAVAEESYRRTLSQTDSLGDPALRENICKYIKKSRGVSCSPDQVIITPSLNFALEIVCSLFRPQECLVGFEDPGLDEARSTFRNHGFRIRTVQVNETGIDVNALEKSDCNMVYLTPSHQFPLGYCMSLSKRLQLMEWCRRRQAYIVENDYNSAFLYQKSPTLSLQSMDRGERVIYMDSLTRILTPEFPCAFLVLPRPLLEVYEKRFGSERTSFLSPIIQMMISQFIEDGQLEHLSRRFSVTATRQYETFCQIFAQEIDRGRVSLSFSPSGPLLLVRFHGLYDQESVIGELRVYSRIRIYPTYQYWSRREDAIKDLYMVGLSCLAENEVEKAFLALKSAVVRLWDKTI